MKVYIRESEHTHLSTNSMSDSPTEEAGQPLGLSGTSKSGRKVSIKLRGFKLTVSVKGDLSPVTIEKITKWARKSTDMHHVVVEKGDNLRDHLHALLCFEQGRLKTSLQDDIYKRFVKPYNEGTIQKFAVRVDVLYDSTWYEEYLRKEEEHRVESTSYDVLKEPCYYPTKEEQALLQDIASKPRVVDEFYAKLATDYLDYVKLRPNPTRKDALEYLYDRMYVTQSMRVVADVRRVRQMSTAIYRFAHKDKTLDFEDRKFLASEYAPTHDFNS